MTAKKPVDPWERTEEVWAAEHAYILEHSLVATEATLAKRRRIIEKRGGKAMPLHLMDLDIIYEADEDEKPDQWMPLGGDSPRPLAWLERRAWHEWYWLRGREPQKARPKIPEPVGRAVVERDWPHCQICGGLIALGEHHIDHIYPYSLGGPATVENLRLTHDLCNIAKGAKVDG